MANAFFQFKQFTVQQDACAMKVCTDASLFGAWCSAELQHENLEHKNLLDIGTGTALLSLMIRQKNSLHIDAVEIDDAAAMQAVRNVQASPWPNDINVHHGDILNMGFSKSYNCITSNPPFYQNELQSANSKRNLAHHSIRLTLPALLLFIKKKLKADGSFFLLLPYKRYAEVNALLHQNDLQLYKEVLVQQTEHHTPFRVMLRGGFLFRDVEKSTITIQTNQQYTPEFTYLLKEYYLYL